jgi:sulfofructose kinase
MAELTKVDIVGVGLNAIDTLISVAGFPTVGSKVEYCGRTIAPGGQVASTVIACQTWGMSTRYVGKVGDDEGAQLHAEAFRTAGVETRVQTVPDAPSLQNVVLIDKHGERSVLCERNERMVLLPEELDREWIVNARVLHVDGRDTAAAIQAAIWAHEAGVLVSADLDEPYPGVDDLLEHVDYLLVSSDFSHRMMNERDTERCLRRMQVLYGCQITAATMGEDGVMAWDGKKLIHKPAYRVPVVDTTGAGDVFRAGFLYGLLKEWTLEQQLDFACAAAALNCMHRGARGGVQTVEAVEEVMVNYSRYGEPEPAISLVSQANVA